jgi:hypothetical protein
MKRFLRECPMANERRPASMFSAPAASLLHRRLCRKSAAPAPLFEGRGDAHDRTIVLIIAGPERIRAG